MKQNDKLVKLHIGCGTNIKEGYSNIDQYVYTSGVIQMDIFNLSFESNSVDEIVTEHMLEHIGKFEVPLALKEWARVLKPDGKLVMNLPNLEWCMHQWLAKPEDERWGWQLDTIFGLQTHPGEFHKTGFTAPRLQQLLKTAGFQNINIRNYWSHAQSCFWVEASKGYSTIAVKCLVSIVVPWWDHSELLEVWEENLKYLPGTEIIFIDNGSAPKGKTALEEFCRIKKIKLLRNETNRGFAAANNQGVKVATGEYIIHLNNDVEIIDSPIESLCNLAAEGLAGPPAHNELGGFYLEGWALCIKRYLLEALGGWCEDYGPGYWDDVDLSHRARLAGYSLSPVPDINRLIRHITNVTGRDGRIDQLALHFHNRKIFIRKYYNTSPKIIVDGIFFQRYQTGIARLWRSLLEEWAANGFGQHIIILDRAETAPKIPGIRYRSIPPHDYSATDGDREMLQRVCDEEGADLFISTYYTTPISTPSVFMAYDMIPEVLGADFEEPMWREKHYGIQHASSYIAISHNTARDLAKFFPQIPLESIAVAQCGVDSNFSPASLAEINQFKTKYGIGKPYFLGVGVGSSYKNSGLFFQAFARLYSKEGFAIVCTGSGGFLPEELRGYTAGTTVYMLHLNDEELRLAYAGAVALVYPSLYEGFGLPILEAMACGCPVITCPNASIPEVAGEAAIYVKDNDVEGMVDALCEVQKPQVRNRLIAAGLSQAQKFSWLGMADKVSGALLEAIRLPFNLSEINFIICPDWGASEEVLGIELGEIFSAIAHHPDKSRITLFIYRGDMAEEDANLFLSGVAMNLLMADDLDITEEIAISLVGSLSKNQWEMLLPRLEGRISLEVEDATVVEEVGAEKLPILTIDTIPEMRGVELVTGNWTLIKLNAINFVIFPDWQEEEESLCQELAEVIKTIITHPESSQISLLIDIANTSEDEANLMLSTVAMNLLMAEELDVEEAREISLIPALTADGWEVLLPYIHSRIILERESQEVRESIPAYKLDYLQGISQTELCLNLANQLFQQSKWQGAIEQYQKILDLEGGDAEVYWQLSQSFRQNNALEDYFNTLDEGIQVYPQDGRLHFHLIIDLQRNGKIESVIQAANRASDLLPDNYTFTLLKYLIIPSIYNDEAEITFYRQRFTDGLQTLIQKTSLATIAEKQEALAGISRFTNFYLGYQAQNDIDLQRQYGNLVHRIMAANYPQWIESKPLPPLKDNQKIRIGYVSAYLHSYSGTLWLKGWLRYCDKNNFEVYCYYTGNSPDLVTQQFRDYSDVFHHIPFDLEATATQILSDKLHILIFPEIGMDAPTMAMAGLRLAPIQCVAWGHPITTGLPTIDYFLSSELMEAENAEAHYSETLIRLPNIGVAYPKPYIPPLSKTRADFQLREDAVIYLSCQAPFKYLPQYDVILPEIARQVPQSQFLFLRGELLKPRLKLAFAQVGLNYEDYCVFRNIPGRDNYLAINLLSDVYLDTITWSGGNTSLEAIACNLPIVTYPGEFMRSRHTDSFLKMLGVTDTIASSEGEYIEIAVKLGLDSAWREEISARMKARHDCLYEDKNCVAGLEAFYQEVVRKRVTKQQ